MTTRIDKMQPDHWAEVARIYAEGIETGHATFQKDVPTWADWDAAHLPYGRLVALKTVENGQNTEGVVLGWAALSAVSNRCVYGGVAELSVYVSAAARGQGVGQLLMENLIQEAEANGLWTLQAGIFPENTGSVQLHLNTGFRQIGFREKVGKMDGVWRDTLLFERRSRVVGV
jgi:L-amino acid N-acyltransferase YncA